MEDKHNMVNELMKTIPGGVALIAYDNQFTILYMSDIFYSLIEGVSYQASPNKAVELFGKIYSADIISVNQQIADQKDMDLFNIRFRVLQYDGNFRWIMIKGKKTEDTHKTGNKEVPVYSCLAADITGDMIRLKQLEQKEDYHRIITDLSRELFFEYEIASDVFEFSKLFNEIFNKNPKIKGFRQKLGKTKIIHPDDLPAVLNIFASMMGGRKQAKLVTRLITKDGEVSTYDSYAIMMYDENRNPYKVIGKLVLINHGSGEKEEAKPRLALDPLTKLYTKASAEKLITESIKEQGDDRVSALILLSFNHREVKEFGGENRSKNSIGVIVELLRQRFRTTDVIGRTGNDEFIVFMQGVYSNKTVCEQADQLCKEVKNIYAYSHGNLGPSISIGITFGRGNKTKYSEMVKEANHALDLAKKVPNSFEVYNN